MNEHLLHELLLTVGSLNFEYRHLEALGKNYESAVIVLLISNEQFALELELDVNGTSELSLSLRVYDNLCTKVSNYIEVTVAIELDRGGVDLTKALKHE